MRSLENEAALVLRRTEYGDSDLMLTLFCRSLGKVRAVARGARRSKKRFAGLGAFTLLEASLRSKDRAELWTLESAQPRLMFAQLAADMTSMAHASYGTELVRELCTESAEPEIFDLLVSLYQSLEQDGPRAGRLRVFELSLLRELGLSPAFDACAGCSATLSEGSYLDPARGGAVCSSCAPEARGAGVRALALEVIELLCQAQRMRQLREGDALDASPVATEARACMLALLYAQVGKPLKSVEFIAKLRRGG